MGRTRTKRLLACVLTLIGFLVAGCGQSEEQPRREARLSDGQPQVELTVQQ